jgi:molybdopterin synthase sulfur carrier subunit
MPDKTIKIQYFAGLREQRGCAEEELETPAETAADLYSELSDRHGFEHPRSSLRVAINDDFTSWDTRLKPDDLVVFIPPVSGG